MTHDSDIEHLIRDAGRDVTMGTPVAHVVQRGRVLRRRRRASRVLAVAAALVVVGGGASVAVSDLGSEHGSDPATARRSSGLGVATDADFAQLCPAGREYDGWDFSSTPVAEIALAAGPGAESVVGLYRSGDVFAWCRLTSDGSGVRLDSTSYNPHFKPTGYVTPEDSCCDLERALATGTVTAEVSRVELVVEGVPIEAALDNGVYAAIIPGDDLSGSVVRAYDGAGDLLEERPLPGS